MSAVYGDDFVFDFDDFSDFEDNSSNNEEDLDEVDDEEVDDEEELPFCTCGLPNNSLMIACEKAKCTVQWYHYSCVGLSAKTIPKGKWICHQCKGNHAAPKQHSSPNQTDAAAQPSTSIPSLTVQPPKPSQHAPSGQQTSSKRKKKNDNSKPKKKQRISKRPDNIYTAADASVAGIDHMTKALEQFESDPLFSIGMIGKNAQELAHYILDHIQDTSIIEFVDNVSSRIWKAVTAGDAKGVTSSGQDDIYASFHHIVSEFEDNWNNMLTSINANEQFLKRTTDLLHHALMTNWLALLIKDRNATDFDGDLHDVDVVDEPALDSHEQQAIMYVAGYIPYSLLKMYKKLANRGNQVAKDYVKLLETWQAPDNDKHEEHGFLDYVKWIELTNRGGLFKPSPELFMFCRCGEGVARKTIDKFTLQHKGHCPRQTDGKRFSGQMLGEISRVQIAI